MIDLCLTHATLFVLLTRWRLGFSWPLAMKVCPVESKFQWVFIIELKGRRIPLPGTIQDG